MKKLSFLALLGLAVLAATSADDIKRYLKMRSM